MTKHYDESFKKTAVALLFRVKKDGSFFTDDMREITTVKALCKELEVSTYSLYQWVKDFSLTADGKKTKPKPNWAKPADGIEIHQWEYSPEQMEALDPNLEYDIFGIRFWGFVGKNLKVSNYHSMPLAQLKYQIAMRLIKQSGLVKSVKDDLKKVFAK